MSQSSLPLQGLKVLDLSRVLAGPYCTMVLADLGANVIKVERPDGGDETRAWGPPFVNDGNSAYFLAANRNKRSLVLDFYNTDDRIVLDRLIGSAEVLVHNFTPEVLGRLNLSEANLRKFNPELIIAGITGFGVGNSFSDQPGYDFLVQAMSGLMAITGEPAGEPMKLGVAVTDILAGLYAALGVLASLVGRDRRVSVSNSVDVSLMQAAVSSLVNVGQSVLVSRGPAKRFGNGHPQIVPYQLFKTKDSYLALAIGNDAQFQRFCRAIAREDWSADRRFSTNPQRVSHRDALVSLMNDVFRLSTTQHWLGVLGACDIPAGPIQRIDEVFASPWAKERQIVAHDEMGVPHIQSPLAKSFGIPQRVSAAPALDSQIKDITW